VRFTDAEAELKPSYGAAVKLGVGYDVPSGFFGN
jgi:hypothetical protein